MFSDIVFPKDNEKKLINMAIRLGYSTLYLVYDSKEDFAKIKIKLEELKDKEIKLKIGVKTNIKNINKFRKFDITLIEASDKSRYIIENSKPNLIYNLELIGRKDFMHHMNSGLNQVLCKLANQNKVAIGINFNNLLKETNLRKDIIIGRTKQNIKLCRKYKVRFITGSFASSAFEMRNPQDLRSFLTVIGMHPEEAKQSIIY